MKLPGFIDFGGVGFDFRLAEVAHDALPHLLFFVQFKIHVRLKSQGYNFPNVRSKVIYYICWKAANPAETG